MAKYIDETGVSVIGKVMDEKIDAKLPKIECMTEEEYGQLENPDNNTFYIIYE